MKRVPFVFGTLALAAALVASSGYSQDKKDPQPKQPKVQLPKGWGKIGVTADQKKQIYEVIGAYQAKIVELKGQIEKLQQEELTAAMKFLSPEQKALLKANAEKTDPGKTDPGKADTGKTDKKDTGKGKDTAKGKDTGKGKG